MFESSKSDMELLRFEFFGLEHQERRKMAGEEELLGRNASFRNVSRRSDSKRHVIEVVFKISIELGGNCKL